jgi:hypothetical protein
MSAPLASDPVPPFRVTPQIAPYKTNRTSVFIIISIALVIVLAGFAVSGTLLVRYAAKFAEIDRTHESLSWDGAPGEVLHTTYKNPEYGVTLTLPGVWKPTQSPNSFLCHLIASDRFNAVLGADFPVLTPSVASDAALVAKRYETNDGWVLNSEESITISGLPAHILRLTSRRNVGVDLVMVKKWPVVYELSVAGPSTDSEHWKMVRAAIPHAIAIR